ncbi:ComEA family DNA-binding protein [uncultured Senegalimassilia sp.]|uniref:ComEA family DNA-binding protein n=1 Tax=uncultured Senegalimassilia sp. TaxID=1714350 RepID=UPI0025FD85D6|nr:ComEA family DNA-binding protein [uncultured Senegalimassilia sp.]
MDFVRYADSVRAKLHMGGAKLPVLMGITAVAICVLIAGGIGLASVLAPDSAFTVEKVEGSQGTSEQAGSSQDAPDSIFVHVGGSVVNPGLYELAGDARVQQAIEAAGGFAEEAAVDALNLAREVKDGEQVIVPSMRQIAVSETFDAQGLGLDSPQPSGALAQGKVDINSATAEQLQQLNGVGPALAQRIVADRQANGPFKSPEDLKRVSGIGDKKYASLADSICVA